jgi:hypothetical protein
VPTYAEFLATQGRLVDGLATTPPTDMIGQRRMCVLGCPGHGKSRYSNCLAVALDTLTADGTLATERNYGTCPDCGMIRSLADCSESTCALCTRWYDAYEGDGGGLELGVTVEISLGACLTFLFDGGYSANIGAGIYYLSTPNDGFIEAFRIGDSTFLTIEEIGRVL